MTTTYDVLVIGGGIVGAATAYALRNKGQSVLMLEQFELGHKKGSSHGDGRVVRFNYAESIYVEMALLGYPAWEKLSEAAGKTLIQKTGLIEYGEKDCAPMRESEIHLTKHNLAYEKLTPQEANERFPQFQFADNTDILYQAEGAIAFANLAVASLWRLFRDNGGNIVTGKRITEMDVTESQVTLTDSDGATYTGAKVVIAAGSWTGQLLKKIGLDIPLDVTQEILTYFPLKETSINHTVGIMPALVDHHNLAHPFYCLPIVDVQGVKVGWHHTGVPMQPDDERVVPDEVVNGASEWIGKVFPHLETTPLEVQTCLYTNTLDYHFILDTHPQYKNVVIGTGFSGHGFKFAPILGELLAGLALEEKLPISLETFALSRFDDPSKIQRMAGV